MNWPDTKRHVMTGREWSVTNVKVCIGGAIHLLVREQQWDEGSDRYLVSICLLEMRRLAGDDPEVKRAMPHVEEMYSRMLNPDAGMRQEAAECGKAALAEFL
jgi:hypothetical protein